MLDIQKLIDAGEEYYEKVKDDASREASWRYCYKEFLNFRRKKLSSADKNYLALHLTAYLASWGMYRGSSFLLQEKNYKVHTDVIEILFQEKYDVLWNLCSEEHLVLLEDLGNKVGQYYQKQRANTNIITTDTLITKVLLGTFGCTPAFDTNLRVSLKKFKIPTSFRKSTMQQLLALYEKYRNEFEQLREKATRFEGIEEYPIMRVLDGCLWQLAEVPKE